MPLLYTQPLNTANIHSICSVAATTKPCLLHKPQCQDYMLEEFPFCTYGPASQTLTYFRTSKYAKPGTKENCCNITAYLYRCKKVRVIHRKSFCPCKSPFVWWFGKTCWTSSVFKFWPKLKKNLIVDKIVFSLPRI